MQSPWEAQPRNSRATSVLLLDSEPLLREATAMMLAKRRAEVRTAGTLDEALELAAERIFDLAILDLPPGAPVAEALAALRASGCPPRRFVVCCAKADAEAAREAALVLEKPFAFDRLGEAVFGRPRQRRPTCSGVFPALRGRSATTRAGASGARPASRGARKDSRTAPPIRAPRRAAQGRRDRG